MTDSRRVLSGVTEPADLSQPFPRLLRELRDKVDDDVIVGYAVGLLGGDDPSRHPAALRHLGGAHATWVLERRDFGLWPAVWGARVLRYLWSPGHAAEATRLLVEHLRDERWRLAEMCTKAVRAHELGEGAEAVGALTGHRLPRVRMQAVRALGVIGEFEQLRLVHACLVDVDQDVRRAADVSLRSLASRLDLDEDRLLAGRF